MSSIKFGRFKNLFTSNYDKYKILNDIKIGKISINDIKYLKLEGYTSFYNKPNENYLYITSYMGSGSYYYFQDGKYYNEVGNFNYEVKNIGYWTSGALDYISLTINNGMMLIERIMKP